MKVIGPNELLFPDSKGNNRLDTFTNALSNPKVGLMFFVQGVDETLRVKGNLTLHDDPELIKLVEGPNFKASMAVRIEVTELFFHCGKAAMRAGLWEGQYKIERSEFPSLGQILKDQQHLDGVPASQDEVVKHYKETL